MLTLYHSGLTQASVKVRLTLKEKGLTYTSHFLRLPDGEHLRPEYLAINPDGQVPALIHDGAIITETSVINEYIDDAFPDPPLKPADALGRARMRRWSQIVDEHLFHAIATIGWSQGIGPILRAEGQGRIRTGAGEDHHSLQTPEVAQGVSRLPAGGPRRGAQVDCARRRTLAEKALAGHRLSRRPRLFARRHQRTVVGRADAALGA